MLVPCACSPSSSTWWNQAKLLPRLNRRETICALSWSNSAVSVFDFCIRSSFRSVFALSIVNDIWPSNSGDKAYAESRVKESEEAIASQRAESKKTLDAAKDAAAVREREFAERLASLTRDVRG